MEYKGNLLTEEESKKYLDGGLEKAAIESYKLLFKKTVFMGPEAEMFKLLKFYEDEYGIHNSVKYVTDTIVQSVFDSATTEMMRKFPMLKVTGFVLETDDYENILYAGVIYIPSGLSYPEKYERLIKYTHDTEVGVGKDSAFLWPKLKNPCEDFSTRYKDSFEDKAKTVSLKYEFPFKFEWNDDVYIFSVNGEYYRLNDDFSLKIDNGTLTGIEGDVNKIVVPKNVKEIASGAFKENTKINSVAALSVKTIGNEAFAYCTNLKSIELGKKLKSIGDEAFSNCERLEKLIIPDSVTSIGDFAFFRCGAGKIVWPKGVTAIPSGTFRECRQLYEVYIPPEVTVIEDRVFGRGTTIIIYGETGSEAEKYAEANGLYFRKHSFS